ncbi:MAG: hypothetical protein K2I64_06770, partial [Muribaculaceae bacterium]|nr:hypothetical protein [Muribaculaceae bacterium]
MFAQTGDGSVWDIPRTGGETITEPSPEATAMRRYQDYPVSYATGTADISIPLLELPGGATSVQLGLSYHTGGIRKTDISTGVGLGWTLTGLGSVSRQINGFPDEWHGDFGKLDLRVFEDDLSYYCDILLGKKDTQYDIYSYSFPGYSGKFMIVDGELRHLTDTDLQISFQYISEGSKEIDSFSFLTPEGVRYEFTDKERIKYEELKEEISWPFILNDYHAISSWNLTRIIDPEYGDGIQIDYQEMTPWIRLHNKSLNTCGLIYIGQLTPPSITNGYTSPRSYIQTKFLSQKLPKKISSRQGTIYFTIARDSHAKSYNPCDYIKEIVLSKSSSGTDAVIKVTLDNCSNRTYNSPKEDPAKFADGRRKLAGIKIERDGVLIENYKFTYDNGTEGDGYDMFGFSNNAGYFSGNASILTPFLLRGEGRITDNKYVSSNTLLKIEDINGLTTDITYEPSTVDFGNTSGPISGKTTIGVRIKQIRVSDTATGRYRDRRFTYQNPVCDMDLFQLKYKDFITLFGWHKALGQFKYIYNLGASFSVSATTRGRPVECAQIYYGKVIEDISGSDISIYAPIRTEYNYNLTHILCNFVKGWYGFIEAPKGAGFGTEPEQGKYLGCFSKQLGFGLSKEQDIVFSQNGISGYFQETVGATPLLSSKITYENIAGVYHERVHESMEYSVQDCGMQLTGMSCESMTFQYILFEEDPILNVTELEKDIRYFYTYIKGIRVTPTKTTTRYTYPDGSTRTVSKDYINTGTGTGNLKHPGFLSSEADSIMTDGSLQFKPLGMITSCGDESISAYVARAEHINSAFYNSAVSRGLRRLPVVEKWVVKTSGGSDSVLRRYEYGRFPTHSVPLTRPTAVSVSAPDKNGVNEISRQKYTEYDFLGRIAGMTDAEGKRMAISWALQYDLLDTLSLPDVGLTTTYTSIPFVGYTSITAPSGRKRQFGYVAGRLASERNTAGETVASYSYRLFGDGSDSADPANRFTATLHDDSGTASQTVDYDGFGLPVRTVADVAGGGQTSTAVEYDALDRPVRQYLPVPYSAGQDAASPLTEAEAYYGGGSYPYRTTTYRPLRTDAPLSVIAEGALMQSHPATVEYLCNTTSGDASLRCRRYSLGSSATSETVTLSGNYPAGALDVTRSTDPDGHRVLTFTDWRGFKILERRIVDAAKSEFADTYWLYDPMGRVRVIIQPEGSGLMTATGSSWTNSSAPLKQYAFISRYDRRGNCIYSLTPGGGPVRMAYDPLNRLAFRHTEAIADDNEECEFFLYDPIGRPAVSGLCYNVFSYRGEPDALPAMTATFDGGSSGVAGSGYVVSSDVSAKLSGAWTTLVSYYDDYSCLSLAGFEQLRTKATSFDTTNAKGSLTATRTTVYKGLQGSYSSLSGASALHAVFGYDKEGRVTSQAETTILTGTTVTTD